MRNTLGCGYFCFGALHIWNGIPTPLSFTPSIPTFRSKYQNAVFEQNVETIAAINICLSVVGYHIKHNPRFVLFENRNGQDGYPRNTFCYYSACLSDDSAKRHYTTGPTST